MGDPRGRERFDGYSFQARAAEEIQPLTSTSQHFTAATNIGCIIPIIRSPRDGVWTTRNTPARPKHIDFFGAHSDAPKYPHLQDGLCGALKINLPVEVRRAAHPHVD